MFQTFNASFICARPADAPEVPHFFQDVCLSTKVVFFRIFRHSKDMYYIWHIYFGYFGHSAPHLFVHALEVPHFFRTFTRAPELFFFQISWTLLGHLLHLKYLCQVFQTFSTSFLCAHSADALEVLHFFRTFTRPSLLFFFEYSGHSQDMYYI